MPPLAPDVAVEILSLDDRRIDVDDKIETYLRAGSMLVIVVDPKERIVELHDPLGVRKIDIDGTITHTALPSFHFAVRALFEVLKRS
jgi:Uma2 family endonuclease